MALTGVAMGLTFSVKLVGFFVVFLIGIATLYELWYIVTDASIPIVMIS